MIDNHIETYMPVVMDGDYILPDLIASYPNRVKAIFLYENEEDQIMENLSSREPNTGQQRSRARVSYLYGRWLRDECKRLALTAIPARPWDTIVERAIAELAI